MPCKTAVSQCVDARMILEARAAGCTVVGGLSILLQKNAEVFRLFPASRCPWKTCSRSSSAEKQRESRRKLFFQLQHRPEREDAQWL